MADKFTLYSYSGSQWAGVAHLTLEEKGFTHDEYDIEWIDLALAENFDPEYLKINPNGTVPSLTSPALAKPLTQSTDILRYLDGLRSSTLVPKTQAAKERGQAIMDLVHSADVDTNIILFRARDSEEMAKKRASGWAPFLRNRQLKLEKEKAAHPDDAFYLSKTPENGSVDRLYTAETGDEHQQFFSQTDELYRTFAEGMHKLESLLVLPYAAGDAVTEADFHVVPWLAHAMFGAETETSSIEDFETLEKLIQKSAPGFRVGPKTRQWWSNIAATRSFKTVFPVLH